jgi:hypothetical protein
LCSPLHQGQEAPNSIDLFVVSVAELLEAKHQFRRNLFFAFRCCLFLDLIEQQVQLLIDFKE